MMMTLVEEIDRIKTMMGLVIENHGMIMSIFDLAEVASRTGNDREAFLIMLRDAYRHSGDHGVIEIFGEMTGHAIEAIRHGHYIMAS